VSAQRILEQLLSSGAAALSQQARGTDWGSFGKGAATGGLLGLLVGSQGGRRLGGKALKYGSVAALGMLAYKVYNDWQAQQQAGGAAPAAPATWSGAPGLPAPEAEQRGRMLLKAMVAAAKADGHLDEVERAKVDEALARLEGDVATRRWLEAELRRPLDPADVAREAAGSQEKASEVYLASLLVVDETSTMERLYLDELARQLALPAGLRQQLEAQARAAVAQAR
jgi:uncharacterized membrane protein YebE (DUF533 family)